ncbi:Glycosyl transferase, group 1 [Pseudonocardia sp. Ae717_Ps2]|uniref:glycosyltransferase family 4 protein n=1 Tax=Pseudonocardia sp. Ae717_Ps2 TaxID=1885573 RepID=UPI00095E62F6|nr:glycosyltransferase family 4 protein [Pseudonocardia sp. Ae717_Ps2]OLM28658.1 Glycosyl transferase, group 1 [Pseudonocardia sp. Ae717_Ps2]
MSAVRRRVTHVLNDVREVGNGINNSTVDLACEQARRGDDVTVVSRGGDFVPLLTECGVGNHTIDAASRRWEFLQYVRVIRGLVRTGGPRIVHAHTLAAVLLSWIAVQTTRMPTARATVTLVSTMHLENKRGVCLHGLSQAVILLNETARARLPRLRRARGVVVAQGTIGGARDRAASDSPARQTSASGGDGVRIVTVCGLYRHKGILTLVEAFAGLRDTIPAATLVFVGDGPDRALLEQRIDALGLRGSVTLAGFQRDPRPAIRDADLFVLASHSEPAGLVLAEARSAGTPIVASDVDGIPTMVDHGRCAVLVPPGNVPALAEAMRRVLTSEQLRAQLLARSEATLEQLSMARVERDVADVYARAGRP